MDDKKIVSQSRKMSQLSQSYTENRKPRGFISRMRCGFSASDFNSILLLLFLYFLQGIPLGMMRSVPYLLQARKATYTAQGGFSLSFWPFSMKLLWAPLVDSIYWARIGRRKSWLIPSQYCIAIIFLLISTQVSYWMGDEEYEAMLLAAQNGTEFTNSTSASTSTVEPLTASTHMAKLTAAFFVVNFLTATQDIVVDGWAISMLSRKNVGWGATCNNVGQHAGGFLAFFLFISLESAEFCNKWLRSEPQPRGIVSFSNFLLFWGIVFAVSTTLILIFKRENPEVEEPAPLTQLNTNEQDEIEVEMPSSASQTKKKTSVEEEVTLGPVDTYTTLWKIIMRRPVQLFVLIIIVMKFTFTPFGQLTDLRLMNQGVPRESVALMDIIFLPINLLLPLFISRYTNGPRPLTVLYNTNWFKLYLCCVTTIFVYFTPRFLLGDKTLPVHYYVLYGTISGLTTAFGAVAWVAQLSFHAKVSDPVVGGTYMTLLNTLSNLSSMLPNTILLFFIDIITQKSCIGGLLDTKSCNRPETEKSCVAGGGECVIWLDGYYIEVGLCIASGIIGFLLTRPVARRLERMPSHLWSVSGKRRPSQVSMI